MRVSLSQLEALVWIVRLGSFRAAARRLNISQPAISGRIRALEEQLRTEVLDRSQPRPRTTRQGAEVVRYAEQMLDLCEKFTERARMGSVNPYEAVLGKPNAIKVDGVYHLWFSAYSMGANVKPSNGNRYEPGTDANGADWRKITSSELGYHIEYARSTDGVNWQREFDKSIMTLTPDGIDSKNQSYPMVLDMGEQLWMFYVGNEFGRTGIALATLDKAHLRR